MKFNLRKIFVSLATIMCFGLGASAQSVAGPWVNQTYDADGFPSTRDEVKFFFSVTGTAQDGTKSTVSATVYDYANDYSFMVQLPANGSEVGADKAIFRAMMRDVNSLDVRPDDVRKHEVEINTNVNGIYQKLGTGDKMWLSHVYRFGGVKVPVTVVDYNHGATKKKTFDYNIQGINDKLQIVGTPSSISAAHDAWYLMTGNGFGVPQKHVTTSRIDGDTYFYIPKGASLQIGNEKITFSDNMTLSQGIFNMEGIASLLNEKSGVPETIDTDNEKVVIVLPATTAFAIHESRAELTEEATITIDLSNYHGNLSLDRPISYIKGEAAKGNNPLIQALLNLFDNLVWMIDEADVVPIEVRFGQPEEKFIQVFPGTSTSLEGLYSPQEFAEVLKTAPNAVGFVWTNLNGVNYATETNIQAVDESGVSNIVIDYIVGKNGHYYECNNFELSDFKNSNAEFIDFYSPKDFNAIKLSYFRKGTSGYNSVCLPFAFSSSDMGGASIWTFSNYNESDEAKGNTEQVYFTEQTMVEAGIPCLVKDGSNPWNVNLTNARVVANPIQSINMKGSFAKKTIGEGHYKLTYREGLPRFVHTTATSDCFAFRSYLDIDEQMGLDHEAKNRVLDIVWCDDSTTKVSSVPSESNTVQSVYSVSGARLNAAQKGLNIIKMADGSVRKVSIK